MDVKLIVVEGDTSSDEVPVTLPTVIGRGRDVGVTLRHPLISRRHCELFESDGRMHVRDLNSLNGTFVDHNNVDETVVPAGSLLTVGGFTFRVDYNDTGSVVESSGGSSEASTISAGDDLAAAFEKMTGEIESTDTAEQEADLNLGSLVDLAELGEETPVEKEEQDTSEAEMPGAEAESPAGSIPTVESVDDEIDLNAMFTEQSAEEATPGIEEMPVADADPVLDLEIIAEPAEETPASPSAEEDVLDLANLEEATPGGEETPVADAGPVLDLEIAAEPADETPVSPSVEDDVLDLADLEEETPEPANAAPVEELPLDLEAIDPEQQGPPASDGDDDDLNSFLNNFK